MIYNKFHGNYGTSNFPVFFVFFLLLMRFYHIKIFSNNEKENYFILIISLLFSFLKSFLPVLTLFRSK